MDVLENGKPLLTHWHVMNDFFTLYNSNAFLISKIPDNDLRKEIVTIYTMAKGLIDSFRFNNELLGKYEQVLSFYTLTNKDVFKQYFDTQNKLMGEYANLIKKSHDELKIKVDKFLRSLRKKEFTMKINKNSMTRLTLTNSKKGLQYNNANNK